MVMADGLAVWLANRQAAELASGLAETVYLAVELAAQLAMGLALR